MNPGFRWFNQSQSVPLEWIRQMTPVPFVVTHLAQFESGDQWPADACRALKTELYRHGLSIGPIESVFLSDQIKLGQPARDKHIENWQKTIRNLAQIGVSIITYNI